MVLIAPSAPPGMPKFKNGAWLAENLDSSYTFLDPDEIGGRTEKIEAPGLDAESFPLKKLPILSPGAFESENSSITEISRRIQEGRKFDDYFPTLTQTWLHHMFHLALNGKPFPILDKPKSMPANESFNSQ